MLDMEFVTSGLEQNVQDITQKITLSVKFAEFRQDFSQNNCCDFVIEKIIAQKLTLSIFCRIKLNFFVSATIRHSVRENSDDSTLTNYLSSFESSKL